MLFLLLLQYVSGPHGTYTQMGYPQQGTPIVQAVSVGVDYNMCNIIYVYIYKPRLDC